METNFSKFRIIGDNFVPLSFKFAPYGLSAVEAAYYTYLCAVVYPALVEIRFDYHHKAVSPFYGQVDDELKARCHA
jgi:hypothetical protein